MSLFMITLQIKFVTYNLIHFINDANDAPHKTPEYFLISKINTGNKMY